MSDLTPKSPLDKYEQPNPLDPQLEIERLCEGAPDAIYLLSGVSEITNPETGEKRYKPGSYQDVDWKGYMTGGKGRAIAVVELSKRFPDATVAVNSNTFNVHDSEAPTDAGVMTEYIERQGVPVENIIQQDRSTTTFTELVELVKYITRYRWKHTVVVAGETQKARAEEMFRQIETLRYDPVSNDPEFRTALKEIKDIDPRVTFVSAEDVLPLRHKLFGLLIADARETDVWKRREASDRQAVEDLKTGNYGKK